MFFGPLRRDRRAVRVFAFTSCDSKNCDCLQPPVRKVLAFMLCWLTDVRHAPSEPPAKRTLADGDRCERVWSVAAARCAWLSWTVFPTKNSSLSNRRSSVTKTHRGCSRRKSSINIAPWGVVRLLWWRGVESTSGPAWSLYGCSNTYTYTLGCPSNFFLYERQGEGGSPSKFFGNTDLKKLRKLRTTPKLLKLQQKFCRQHQVQLPNLSNRFKFHTLTLFYKIRNGLAPTYLSEILPETLALSSGRNLRRHVYPFPRINKSSTMQSFLPRATVFWNELPASIQSSSSLHSFKAKLRDLLKI